MAARIPAIERLSLGAATPRGTARPAPGASPGALLAALDSSRIVGEAAQGPAAAALGNAVTDATCVRVREVPLSRARMRLALGP